MLNAVVDTPAFASLPSRPPEPPLRNPYRVPRPAVVSFSGGRTSGYMLKHVVDAYGGRLPDDIAVVFANTGMEHPATLDFVDRCAHAWDIHIHWVEYDWDAPHRTRYVDHDSAAFTQLGSPNASPVHANAHDHATLPP